MTNCPRCGKTLHPDSIHTCSPRALVLADALETFHNPNDKQAAAELRRLHQSEREGWRYANELEQERKQLQVMLNEERSESEALLRQALAALEDVVEGCEEPHVTAAAITAIRARLSTGDSASPVGNLTEGS